MIFEKRPEQVHAIQWTGNLWHGRTPAWVGKLQAFSHGDNNSGWLGYLLVLEGDKPFLINHNTGKIQFLEKDDWLIHEPEHDYIHVLDDETFRRKFKRVGL